MLLVDERAISIHAPTWGATPTLSRLLQFNIFQSTHPRGVRRLANLHRAHGKAHFNPRTHVGCDVEDKDLSNKIKISIHAPTWGATLEFTVISLRYIFQSTHPRGVRHCFSSINQTCQNFNPRTHVGCDFIVFFINQTCQNFNPRTHVGCDIKGGQKPPYKNISIHAPTWGATFIAWNSFWENLFQSTHPRGVRRGLLPPFVVIYPFQSTHPRGVRLRQIFTLFLICCHFNPRTHVGCDAINKVNDETICISIHAPTWGATRIALRSFSVFPISIHAPTWGATRIALRSFSVFPISIHAPTWGATFDTFHILFIQKISIHAPTWGATVKPSNGWLLGHKDNEFANENIIIINSVNIT